MGRGVSSGGGQSSLGYLFGSGEAPKRTAITNGTRPAAGRNPQKSTTTPPSPPPGVAKEIPAGIPGNTTITNNYFRADGQNCGNFLTDRPTTKVHAAPGGGSSLDYLFGGNGK
ncbi:Protein SPIRAL1 [Hibiscus syriacus]|uniref:Protein SPIRAL1 n=1 Tax=Hibiscus syriacus TaxID=106335 RepID=A0A6A3CI28_HIBSY|nr:Protein SPIRAL1 [Hibiscus syriacus]